MARIGSHRRRRYRTCRIPCRNAQHQIQATQPGVAVDEQHFASVRASAQPSPAVTVDLPVPPFPDVTTATEPMSFLLPLSACRPETNPHNCVRIFVQCTTKKTEHKGKLLINSKAGKIDEW